MDKDEMTSLNFGQFVSVIIILESIAAAVGYGFAGDWRRMAYWIASAVLVTSVTI